MKNDGKKSEELFAAAIAKVGKTAYLERLYDTTSISKKGQKVKFYLPTRPSDWILTLQGHMAYTEIKSTSHKTGFQFSALTIGQKAAITRQFAAKGNYWIFIHRLETNQWYWIHGSTVLAVQNSGKQSMKWIELEPYKWELPRAKEEIKEVEAGS